MRKHLDKTDYRILAALEQDGRLQNQQLAEKVCLSPGACSQRLRRLERGKYIKGYKARLDIRKVCNSVTSIAVVKLNGQGGMKQNRFLTALESMPEVVECLEVAGEADYVVRFMCVSLEDYNACTEKLVSDPAFEVENVESLIVLRQISNLERSNTMHLIERNELLE